MNLTKMEPGQRINLSKNNPGQSHIKIGLGWDVKEGVTADSDISILCLNAEGKLLEEKALVCYQNRSYGSIKHSGDNRTGEGEGDDEVVTVDLKDLPAGVESLLVVITSSNKFSLTPMLYVSKVLLQSTFKG